MAIVERPANRTNIDDSANYYERDFSIPRNPASEMAKLLFGQITGGICVGHEVIFITSDKESGFICVDETSVPLPVGKDWLYATCVLIADTTSSEDIKAYFRQDQMKEGWKYFEDTDTSTFFWNLPDTADHVSNELPPIGGVGAYGMPIGDKAVFEIRGRTNVLNFRIKGTESGKTHRLFVSYFK